MNLEQFFKPLRNPKFTGTIIVATAGMSMLLAALDYIPINRKVNHLYSEFGGTNATLSIEQKIEYIQSQSNYSNNPANVHFIERVAKREQ